MLLRSVLIGGLVVLIVVIASVTESERTAGGSGARASESSQGEIKEMQSAMAGVLSLRTGAKDPESFVLRSVVIKDSGVVCYEFRAKNSYGAEMPGEAVLTKKKLFIHEQDGNAFVRAWNKECTGEGGKEVAPGLAKWLTRVNRRAAGG